MSRDQNSLNALDGLARANGLEILVEEGIARISGATACADNGGVDFGLFYFSDNDNPASQDDYGLYMAGGRAADQLGFRAIWTPERHFTNVGAASPNPAVLSAALAVVTERVELRSGSVVAPLHDPIRIAEEWAMVDRLSRGRVALSFASGWVPADFVFAPDSYARRREETIEIVDCVQRLWRGEAITRRGGNGEDCEVLIRPRPFQPELPVWLTAATSIDTFKAAGRCGYNVLTALLQLNVEQIAEFTAAYRIERAAAGHDPATGRVAVMLHTYVTNDEEDARAEALDHLTTYFRSQTQLRKDVAVARGRSVNFEARHIDPIIRHSAERYIKDKALIGSPASCDALVRRLADCGVNEIACLIDFGIDTHKVLAGLTTLNQLRLRWRSSPMAKAISEIDRQATAMGLQILVVDDSQNGAA